MSDNQDTRYTIIFLGPARNTIEDVNKVAHGLQSRFHLSSEAVTKVMRLAPVTIKKDVSVADARQYKEALEAIGAKVKLEPIRHVNEEPEEEKSASPPLDKEPQTIPLQKRTASPPPDTSPTMDPQQKQKMTQCPQCGFVQDESDECIRCGVIISKFLKYQEEIKSMGGMGGQKNPQDSIGTPLFLEEEEGTTPWDDMANLGFVTAFFRTMKEVLFSPTLFFKKMPVDKGIQNPLFYGVITTFVMTIIGLLGQYATLGFFGGFAERGGMEGVSLFQVSSLIIYAFFLPVFIAIWLFIASGILHVCLMIVGGSKRGFEATFRVVAYACSTNIFSMVPIIGPLIYLFYTLVIYVIGFRESHRTTTGRAFTAVIIPLLIAVVFIVLLVVAVLIPLIASLPQIMQQQPPSL